jgi:hypothetical protein
VTARREWVATSTFVSGRDESFYEEGGIYARRVVGDTRLLDPTERVVTCPRCGARFAATESTPEENRDLHSTVTRMKRGTKR